MCDSGGWGGRAGWLDEQGVCPPEGVFFLFTFLILSREDDGLSASGVNISKSS